MNFVIGTFNLRVDLPQDGENSWQNRAGKVSEIIHAHQPLVFGAQEALIHMIRDLEADLPDYQWFGEGRKGGMADEFCPVFYNVKQLDCVKWGQFWLSEQPNVPGSISWKSDFPRICTWGHFRFKQESFKEFVVYNTHLDHVSSLARENGISLIGEKLSSHYLNNKIPALLIGDLNSKPSDKVIKFLRGILSLNGLTVDLKDAYKGIDRQPGRTFHKFEGGTAGEPIDYIFCTKEFEIINTKIDRSSIKGSYPSDHYPLMTTVAVKSL
ncbi:endonuclease/exonuclease/phosphatase family protein [Halobacillus sp. Marseille-Q1614]|uniref:endonuclease/exonuclease/phosphatase family protein n=1 Tax=Halobacillus sp. Marseille-Q1614 TaxID=2709134 RepID=UPI00156ED56A|nr:endonuclease/exonuclease/phosphatase family protein [Halobacillus sp. Marseille-Q1614]